MKLKALLIIAASLSTVAIVAVGALRGASQQMWNPQMTQAAKVTVKLLHGKGFSPILFARSNRALIKSNQPFAVPFSHSDELLSHTLKNRLFLVPDYSQADSQAKPSHAVEVTGSRSESAIDQHLILLNSQVSTPKP